MEDKIFSDSLGKALPLTDAIVTPSVPLALPCFLGALSENPKALELGLMALADSLEDSGSMFRQEAINTLIEKLDLNNFVRDNQFYKNTNRAATSILQGLVKKGYVTRWMCPKRLYNKSRATTKGYILTPSGRTALENTLAKNPDIGKTHKLDSMIRVSESDAVELVKKNLDKLEPLLKEHEAATASLRDCDELLNTLEKKKFNLRQQLMSLQEEINGYESLRAEDQARLDNIDRQIRHLVS